jgi:hypothetical protein
VIDVLPICEKQMPPANSASRLIRIMKMLGVLPPPDHSRQENSLELGSAGLATDLKAHHRANARPVEPP